MVIGTEKQFKKFLKERHLTRTFREWERSRVHKKRIITIALPTYAGDLKPTKVYVYRQKNKTVFKDFNTLEVLGYSRRKVNSAINALFSQRTEKEGYKEKRFENTVNLGTKDNPQYYTHEIGGWNVLYKFKESGIKLQSKRIKYSYNEKLERLRSVTSTNVARKDIVRMLVCDITYIGIGGKKAHVVIRSSGFKFLYHKSVRDEMIAANIHNGMKLAGFSPIDVILNGIWYEYWEDKHERLKRIK